MWLKNLVRNLIIGEQKYIESYGQFKRVMLSGTFALVGIIALSLYFTIDVLSHIFETLPVYSTSIALLSYSIFLNRKGRYCTANYFLFPTLNATIYLFASSESPHTGAFILFLPSTLAAFAVFGYTQRIFSILMAISSYVLFVLAYFIDFAILPRRDYTAEMELLNIIINFSVGMPSAIMVIYLMISLSHRNAMELLNSNNLLKKVNAELDRFVYSTSHDLRAPLASVLGLIDIADRTPNGDEVKNYLGMMRDRVFSLDKFVRDITDYSRNNRLEVVREKFRLTELTCEIWETLKYAPEAVAIDFHLEIPEDAEVETDRNRLRIVLTNLIANSIRYHDHRKEDRYIRVRYQVNGKSFYLKVEDNGLGIEPEYQGKVFDMFFRANEKSKGSGLGLYIVKETMAKLAGSIQIESAPSVGTTVTVKIPYKRNEWIPIPPQNHLVMNN